MHIVLKYCPTGGGICGVVRVLCEGLAWICGAWGSSAPQVVLMTFLVGPGEEAWDCESCPHGHCAAQSSLCHAPGLLALCHPMGSTRKWSALWLLSSGRSGRQAGGLVSLYARWNKEVLWGLLILSYLCELLAPGTSMPSRSSEPGRDKLGSSKNSRAGNKIN